MKSEFLIAVTQLAAERNLPKEAVLGAIEAALASAYKKDNAVVGQNIAVRLNPASGEARVFVLKTVVEEVTDERKEMSAKEAQAFKKDAKVGDTIEIETTSYIAGRIAAQTARQVVMQRLREAERELVYAEFSQRADDIVSGLVQRLEPKQIVVDLGRAEAVLPAQEQVPTERYRAGQRMKFYIVEVRRTSKGPEIVVSRSHRNLLRRLFELEVPEIHSGVVEIKAIAREGGSRSKVAVTSRQEGVDPVGSCVGLRGIRIQNIVNELQGEKIDVVQWHRDPAVFIANALSPSQVLRVNPNEAAKEATVIVPDGQLSLAIGREGQNARLAAKLTGWKIDIKGAQEAEAERQRVAQEEAVAQQVAKAKVEAAPAVETVAAPEPTPAPAPLEIPAPPERVLEPVAKAEPVSQPEPEVRMPAASIEEELAAATVQAERPAAVAEPETEGVKLTEDIWKVPVAIKRPSVIRFAEDIMGGTPGRGPKDKKAKKGRDEGDGAKRRKGAKTARVQPEAAEDAAEDDV